MARTFLVIVYLTGMIILWAAWMRETPIVFMDYGEPYYDTMEVVE